MSSKIVTGGPSHRLQFMKAVIRGRGIKDEAEASRIASDELRLESKESAPLLKAMQDFYE